MRLKPGARMVLVDPAQGQPYQAEFKGFSGQEARMLLLHPLERTQDSGPRVIAVVSLIKGQRWDWMIQKLTELGVSEIIPVQSQRTVIDVKHPENKLERWTSIAKGAAEQSERLTIPVIHPPVGLSHYLKNLSKDSGQIQWVASERGGQTLSVSVAEKTGSDCQTVVFAIGPEGGWTPEELTQFYTYGFQSVSLGDRILRSETAALYLMSVLHYAFATVDDDAKPD